MKCLCTYFFISLLLVTAACKKGNSDVPSGSRLDSITIRKVSDNSLSSGVKFNYDATGNLTQYLSNNVLLTEFKYSTQNRLLSATYSNSGSPASVDSFIYNNTGQIVQSFQRIIGVNTTKISRAFGYDNQGRMIADSGFNAMSIPTTIYVYNYNSTDNIISRKIYSSSYNSTSISYYLQDSTSFTHDSYANPQYNKKTAMYFCGFMEFALSKNNIISRTIFYGTATQSDNSLPFVVDYYHNNLLRSRVIGNVSATAFRWEFLYN